MSIFNRNKSSRGGGGDRNSRGGGGDRREDRQMHRATCADCGRDCEVPFRPSGGKPVYCNNCFKRDSKPSGGDRNFRGGDRRDDRRDDRREDRQMHRATCADCGRNCEVPFRPSGGKPVYCSNCFEKGGEKGGSNSSSRKPDQSNKKHDEINAKLDKILFLLQNMNPGKEETVKKPKKEKAVKKKAAKKAPAKKAVVKKVVKKKAVKKVKKKVAAKKAK